MSPLRQPGMIQGFWGSYLHHAKPTQVQAAITVLVSGIVTRMGVASIRLLSSMVGMRQGTEPAGGRIEDSCGSALPFFQMGMIGQARMSTRRSAMMLYDVYPISMLPISRPRLYSRRSLITRSRSASNRSLASLTLIFPASTSRHSLSLSAARTSTSRSPQ
jgi:hypothetical protein